jgi:3-oxoacyl-[acyl-carrier protein] reductase
LPVKIASAAKNAGIWLNPNPAIADYAEAKDAVVNLTVSLAQELAYTGVTANTISPGTILTSALKNVVRGIATQNG